MDESVADGSVSVWIPNLDSEKEQVGTYNFKLLMIKKKIFLRFHTTFNADPDPLAKHGRLGRIRTRIESGVKPQE